MVKFYAESLMARFVVWLGSPWALLVMMAMVVVVMLVRCPVVSASWHARDGIISAHGLVWRNMMGFSDDAPIERGELQCVT